MAELTTRLDRVRRFFARAAISLVLLAMVFRVVDVDVVTLAFRRLGTAAWGLALAAFLGLHALSALKWRWFLSSCGVELTRADALRFYAAGLFANLCLPSLVGGDVVRAALAVKRGGGTESVLLAGLVDRAADTGALFLLVGLGVAAAPATLHRLPEGSMEAKAVVLAAPILALAGATALILVARGRLRSRRLPRGLARSLFRLRRAWRRLRERGTGAALAFVACALLQSGFVAVNAFMGRTMGMALDLALWYLLWPLAKILAMAPISLGGLGVREAAFGSLVAPFDDGALAVAQSLAWQSVLIAGGLLAGVLYATTARRS